MTIRFDDQTDELDQAVTLVTDRVADRLIEAIEHDDSTAQATVALIAGTGTGAFTDVTARRDLTGRPRFVTARRTACENNS